MLLAIRSERGSVGSSGGATPPADLRCCRRILIRIPGTSSTLLSAGVSFLASTCYKSCGGRLLQNATSLRSRQIVDQDIKVLAKLLGRGLGYPERYFLHVF